MGTWGQGLPGVDFWGGLLGWLSGIFFFGERYYGYVAVHMFKGLIVISLEYANFFKGLRVGVGG